MHLRHFLLGFGNIFAFSSMFILALMMPLIGDGDRFKKIGLISLIIFFIYLILGVMALLFLIPSITEINNTLSIYILARQVNFGDFIQRIDAIFILIWVMSIFSYLAITTYFTLNTFKKVFNVKHKKSMIYSISALIFIISMLPKNISDVTIFESSFYKYTSIAFVFVICLAILVSGYIKKKAELKKGEKELEETS